MPNQRQSNRRLCARHIERFPVGSDREIVHLPSTGQNVLVPRNVIEVLGACHPFRSVDEHARLLARTFGNGREVSTFAHIVEELASAGFLVALEDVAASGSSTPAPPPIETIGIVTCNRPTALQRAVRSYAENARGNGRDVEIVVCDDTPSADHRSDARAFLRRQARELGTRIRYIGLEEKRHLAERLAALSGVERRVVDFALFDPLLCGTTIGANRNALSLLNAGTMFLSADDDTICTPVRAPDFADTLRFVGEKDPQEYWFFPSRAAALAEGRYEPMDIVGEHERLLGRSLANLVAREPSACLDGVCSHMVDAMGRIGHIALTVSGIVGDSGMNMSTVLLACRPPTRDRLVASEATYQQALRSRAILRAARAPAVAHVMPLASTAFGLDARALLPPFFPVLRNEDGIFSSVLAHRFSTTFEGFPAHAVIHDPVEERTGYETSHRDGARLTKLSHLLIALIADLPHRPTAPASALATLGAQLKDVAAQSPADFEASMKRAVAIWAQNAAGLYGRLRHEFRDTPHFWAEDMRAITDNRCDAATDSRWIPVDLPSSGTLPACELVRRLIGTYGDLLCAWEALVGASARAGRLADLGQLAGLAA